MRTIIIGAVAALGLVLTGCNYGRTPSHSPSAPAESQGGTGGAGLNPVGPSNQSQQDQRTTEQGKRQQNAKQGPTRGSGSNP